MTDFTETLYLKDFSIDNGRNFLPQTNPTIGYKGYRELGHNSIYIILKLIIVW